MSKLPKVFISEPINSKGTEILEGKVNMVLAPDTTKETAMALIADADAAILRATTIFDKDVIEKGANLKILQEQVWGWIMLI
jgi:D-3-phosphoglycerate dehydrogenase